MLGFVGIVRICWDLLGLLEYVGICRDLSGFVAICWDLLGFAEFVGISRDLLGFVGICWDLLGFVGICWDLNLLGFGIFFRLRDFLLYKILTLPPELGSTQFLSPVSTLLRSPEWKFRDSPLPSASGSLC
jgi:hypothetical protein